MSTVRICLPMDAANGTNDFATADIAGRVWTLQGGATAAFSNVFQRNSRNTLKFNGNGGIYLSADELSKINFDNQSFRVRFWWRPTSFATYSSVLGGYLSYASNKGITLFDNHAAASGKLSVAYNGGSPFGFPALVSTTSMVANTTYHIQFSVQKVSGSSFTYRVFVNGVLEDSDSTSTGAMRSGAFIIGSAGDSASHANGYMSDFELLIGDHGESATFTPPTSIAATLAGTVLDADSNPAVRRIRIIARNELLDEPQRILTSDGAGVWSLRVPQQVYNVTIEDDDADDVLKDIHFGRVTAVPE